jgi:erythronate-4-phosphate dehydrogenase
MKLMIDDAVWGFKEIFSYFGEIVTLPGREIDRQSLLDCEILIVRSRTKVNKELLEGTKVQFVGSTVAGLNHIDEAYLQANNITFTSAQGSNANAVAEYVISALANLANDYSFDLSSKMLGIIGVGNVGSSLDFKAKQLGITTLLNDPPRQEIEGKENFVDLNTALSADIVTFHTPLTFSGSHPTYNLLGSHNFKLISQDSIVINTARGGIIDEDLWEKTKTKANVIDCWEDEPNINTKLQSSAYWGTPHIAGHSIDAKFMGSYMIYKDLCKFTKTPLKNEVEHLINPAVVTINENTLHKTLNAIYPFIDDNLTIKDISKFEDYRRNYPNRFEWRHFKTRFNIPQAKK